MTRRPTSQVVIVLRRNIKAALRAGKAVEAESILEQLKREDPLSVETRGLELEILLETDRLDEAGALGRQLLQNFPASPRIHYLAGRVEYRRRDYAPAVSHLRESQRLHQHWKTLYWLGKALTQRGEFDEAERLLIESVGRDPFALLDLAWLYERRGEDRRALGLVEDYSRDHPGDERAQAQLRRLKARLLEPGELRAEVETLFDLGEKVSDDIFPQYLEDLLRSGEGKKAREIVNAQAAALDPHLATRLGWVSYRLQAYDLALALFLKAFSQNRADFKFLNAIELAAGRCGRTEDLIGLYRANAPDERNLYGRIKRLEARQPKARER